MNEHLRLSDAERDGAAADLGEHYAQGRLTVEEHGERLDRIWAARTRGELGPIFADLPGPVAGTAPAAVGPIRPGRVPRSPRRFRGLPIPLVVLLAVLLMVTVVSHLPLILIGLAAWFVLSRRGCSTHAVRHPVRHR